MKRDRNLLECLKKYFRLPSYAFDPRNHTRERETGQASRVEFILFAMLHGQLPRDVVRGEPRLNALNNLIQDLNKKEIIDQSLRFGARIKRDHLTYHTFENPFLHFVSNALRVNKIDLIRDVYSSIDVSKLNFKIDDDYNLTSIQKCEVEEMDKFVYYEFNYDDAENPAIRERICTPFFFFNNIIFKFEPREERYIYGCSDHDMKIKSHVFVLTDNLDAAIHLNTQTLLFQYGIRVVSWNDDGTNLSLVKFDRLTGRHVYILLFLHSNRNVGETLERGRSIAAVLKDFKLLSVKVISYLPSLTDMTRCDNSRASYPGLIDVDDFLAGNLEGKVQKISFPVNAFRDLAAASCFTSDRKFHPALALPSVNLFRYRDAGVGEALASFIWSLAFSLATGQAVFGKWRGARSIPVTVFTGRQGKVRNKFKLEYLGINIEGVIKVVDLHAVGACQALSLWEVLDKALPWSENNGVIIFDYFSYEEFRGDCMFPNQAGALHSFLKEMVRRGYIVIIAAALSDRDLKKLSAAIHVDSIVECSWPIGYTAEFEELRLVQRHSQGGPSFDPVDIELRPEAGTMAWRMITRHNPLMYELQVVLGYMISRVSKTGNKKKTMKDVQSDLGITMAMVKKRIRQLQGKENFRDPITGKIQTVVINPDRTPHIQFVEVERKATLGKLFGRRRKSSESNPEN